MVDVSGLCQVEGVQREPLVAWLGTGATLCRQKKITGRKGREISYGLKLKCVIDHLIFKIEEVYVLVM